MSFRLLFTLEAKADLERLYAFAAENDPAAAEHALAVIDKAWDMLEEFPASFPISWSMKKSPLPSIPIISILSRMPLNSASSSCCSATYHCRKLKQAAICRYRLGFGLGGFVSQLVVLFENSAEFNKFMAQDMDATADVSAMTGDDKEQLALRFNEGKAVFVLTGKR